MHSWRDQHETSPPAISASHGRRCRDAGCVTVRLVPNLPGSTGANGTQDVIARLIGQWLADRLGQQFIIENRLGAGGNIGAEAVVRATADGYTILLVRPPNARTMALNVIRACGRWQWPTRAGVPPMI
jgi:hypothetical protein